MSTNNPLDFPPQRPQFDPFTHTGLPRGRGAGSIVSAALFLIIVAIVVRTVWGLWQFTQTNQDTLSADTFARVRPIDVGSTDQPSSPRVIPTLSPPITDEVVHSGSGQPHLDLAKVAQRELLNVAEDLRRQLGLWESEIHQWQTAVEPLLQNDQGRALASNSTLLDGFRAVHGESLPAATRIAEIRELAKLLTSNAEAAIGDRQNAYLPEEAAQQRLGSLAEEARQAAERYQQARLQIASLVDEARRSGAKADKTLAEAIADQERGERATEVAAARERLQAARNESAAKVTAAEEAAIRLEGDVKVRKITAEAEAAKARQAAAEEQRKNDEAKQRRLAALERDMAEVQRYLSPLITKGYAQPVGPRRAVQSGEAMPMSLSKLETAGALHSTLEGLECLTILATTQNDREHGRFPQYAWTDSGWQVSNKEFVRRAQELLKLHGNAMVERGLLSP